MAVSGGYGFRGNARKPILGFKDGEKVGGIPNTNFPLVITSTIASVDVSGVLVNGGVRATSHAQNS